LRRSLGFHVSKSAGKKINKAEPQLRKRLLDKLQEYESEPDLLAADLKRLADTKDPVLYRIRMGNYRVVGSIEGDYFNVLDFIHRRDL